LNIDYGSSVPVLEGMIAYARGVLGQFLPFAELKGRVRGVYVLLKAGAPVYVGQTKAVRHRIEQHKLSKDFDDVIYLPVSSMHDRLRLESVLIAALNPPTNKGIYVSRNQAASHGFAPLHFRKARLTGEDWD